MKHLSTPAFAALLVGLGAVTATPAPANAESIPFIWSTGDGAASGQFGISNIDEFRRTFEDVQPGVPSPRFPIDNPTLIVDGMDTGPAFTDPNDPENPPPYIELLQQQGPDQQIWDVWSVHFHNPWDWTWITFGSFASNQEAIDAILTPGNLAQGMVMLMPTDGSATQNLPVGVQTVPEPLTMLGVGTALGFGGFFKREIAKKQKKSGKKVG